MKVSTHAWFNGCVEKLETGAPSIASANFHLGTSVFDGLMAYWNNDHYYIHRCAEHFERFRLGAAQMGLYLPWSTDSLIAGTHELLLWEPACTQYIRPIAYRRVPELWVTGAEGKPVDVSIFTVPIVREIDNPLTCHVSAVERISSRSIPGQTKVSGAYVNSFTARKQAEANGFQEALMLDRHGRLAEASAANAFFIEGLDLITPPLNEDIFPGITRSSVITLAAEAGITLSQRDVRFEDIARFSGAFVCSTLMEIRPLSCIGATQLCTTKTDVYQEVLRRFCRLVQQ